MSIIFIVKKNTEKKKLILFIFFLKKNVSTFYTEKGKIVRQKKLKNKIIKD